MRIKRNLVASFALIALGMGMWATLPSFSAQSRVNLAFEKGYDEKFIPKNLTWGSKSTSAAKEAIAFAMKEAEAELNNLKTQGSIRVTKSLVETPNNSYPDFKSYVSEYSQYELHGFDSQGREVAKSSSLPMDFTNLAAMLVTVAQSECRLTDNEPSTANLPLCSITSPTISAFLRASLKTALSQGSLDDAGGDVYQRLLACLSGTSKIALKGNVLNCPQNKAIFGTASIPLKGKFATRSYKITVDLSNRTAQMLYSKRDYSKVAKNGSYDSWAVVNFR